MVDRLGGGSSGRELPGGDPRGAVGQFAGRLGRGVGNESNQLNRTNQHLLGDLSMSKSQNRRTFLKASALAAGAAALPAKSYAKVAEANGKINIGFVGV